MTPLILVATLAAAASDRAPSPEDLAVLPGTHAVHAADVTLHTGASELRPAPLPDVTPGPDRIVYGYQAYWNADLNAVPWDHLSHLAVFSANATPSGGLTYTSRWDLADEAVAIAGPYGVKVHLCVTNFSPSELSTLLGSATARAALIGLLDQWVDDTGADGVNIDFEGLPSTQRDNMVTFTQDLAAVVPEVVLATPSVDWTDAWDYAALSQVADLFIMGYGYHWSGSDYAGPVDPLYGGSPWAAWSLSWTVDDYLDNGADPDRVILGLPLYGIRWPVVSGSVPSATTGTGSSIIWSSAHSEAATYGAQFDADSRTPYWYDGARQGWYGDTDSLRERVQYADDAGIGGIGFWALHYDGGDAELWQMLADETFPEDGPDDPPDDSEDPEDNPDLVADAGNPFLAYVGDTVILSGAASEGPDDLLYEWAQVSGPPAELDDPTAMEPSFPVKDTGALVFELRVGDGEVWSEPARSHVVVLDPAIGHRYRGCATGPAAPAWLFLLFAFGIRRRR